MRKWNRIAALVLSGVLTVTGLSACGKAPAGGGTETSAAGTAGTAGTVQGSTENGGGAEKEKITIGIQQSLNVENYDTNYLTTYLEEEFNVDIEFMILPADGNDAKSKLSMMVSSGSELPDILAMELPSTTAYEYASKGVFVKLTDYFNDKEKSPNYWAIPDEDREIMTATAKLADGELYCVPGYGPFKWNLGPYRMWLNTEWMDKLGLEAPTNTEEFYQVCKAFAEQDPNGNGKKDEIAIAGSKDGWAQKPFVYIMNAFVYANPDKQYFNIEDGKVVPAFTKDEWKAGLEYMKKLVDEGLFSPLSFTQDQAQLKALIGVDDGMAGFVASGSGSTFNTNPNIENAMMLVGPMTGPEGHVSTPYNPAVARLQWWITKDCENVDLAYRMGEMMYRHDLARITRYGEEGVDWTEDPEICSKWMGEHERLMGLPTTLVMLNNVWNVPQNKMWGFDFLGYRSNESSMGIGAYEKEKPDEKALHGEEIRQVFAEKYVPAYQEDVILNISFTAEETQAISNAKTAIDTYVYDTAIAFITNNRPLSDWDKYLSELDAMGLKEYTAAMQTAYDRTK